jgi:peptidoglycan/LPS O-acetylase OafA/YrhL
MIECRKYLLHTKRDDVAMSASALNTNKTLNSIQAMRGIAAVLVMLFHYRLNFNFSFYNFGNEILISGAVGVPLFFIISGFIMGYTQKNDGPSASLKFVINRLCRIVPLYYFCTILWVIMLNVNMDDASSFNDSINMFKSFMFIPLSSDTPPGFGYATLFVGWSLNYEVFFYLLFAMSLLLGRFKWVFFFTATFALLVVVPGIVDSPTLNAEHAYGFTNPYVAMATNPLIWNFAAGVAIALIIGKVNFDFAATYIKWASWLCIILFAWQYLSGFNAGVSINKWGIFSCLLLFFMTLREKIFGCNAPKFLVFLGEISFSIYLMHPIAKEMVYAVLRNAGDKYTSGFVFGITCVAITILLSAATHRFIELRVSNAIKYKLLPAKAQ